MDESEKRRERLKRMRMEAEQEEAPSTPVTSTPSCLFNPLVDIHGTPPIVENSPSVRRFEYYTDPMSAFANAKRNNDYSRNLQTPLHTSNITPMSQMLSSSSGMGNPLLRPVLSPGLHTPDPMHYGPSSPVMWRSPSTMASPYPGPRGSPISYSTSWGRSSPGYGGRGACLSPGYGEKGGSSPIAFSIGGSNRQFNHSPNFSSRGRGRQHGSHVSALSKEKHELYRSSMVQDPWVSLKPVVGSLLGSGRSWLPKSVSMKEAKLSEKPIEVNSKSSLADCLVSSLEEAIGDTSNF